LRAGNGGVFARFQKGWLAVSAAVGNKSYRHEG